METNFTEEYKKWIINLSEPNFNELIVNFAKEYYDTKEVHISNGPYDGGIDLVYAKNGKEQKRNIQITIQEKGYETKLREDLKKASENSEKYAYQKRLDFYISQKITQSKKNELVREAELDYEIDLKIYDANKLSGLASEYKSIRNTIQKFNTVAFPAENIKIDKNTKILFDTLTMSRDTTQLKNDFVKSFILFHFFEHGESKVSDVVDGLKKVFYDKFQNSFYENEIGRLKLEGSIQVISDSKPKTYDLSSEMREKFEKINQKAEIQEAELLSEVNKILTRFNLMQETESIVNLLVELYNSNYESDISETQHVTNGHNRKIHKIFSEIICYIQKNSDISENQANDIARNLLVVCKKNDYLNKASISGMFTNLFKSDKLEYYLSQTERKVYLDTQILLQCICNIYSEENIDDQLYNAIRVFLDSIENAKIPISLNTTTDYVSEVAAHIQNALKLENFLSLDYIQDLGKSKNVIFNYYLALKEKGADFEDFSAFVNDLLEIETPAYDDLNFIEIVAQVIIERFEMLEINVETPRWYEPNEYKKYRKEYEISLSYSQHDNKSYEARKHDLNAILHICDNQFDMKEYDFIEPYFITWDTSFYEARKSLLKLKNLSFWYLMPPLKFANTISLIDFKVNNEALNYNIISMVEDNFNLSSQSISFFDLMSSFVDTGKVSKWKLGGIFAKMRSKLRDELDIKDFQKIKHGNLPIDELLLMIRNHYQNPGTTHKFSEIISLFQNNDFADEISNLIESNLNNFMDGKNLKASIIEGLDTLIEKNNGA